MQICSVMGSNALQSIYPLWVEIPWYYESDAWYPMGKEAKEQ